MAESDVVDSSSSSKKKSKKWIQKYKPEYSQAFNFVRKSSKSDEHAFCTVCSVDFSIAHGGRNDITQHAATIKHATNYKVRGCGSSIVSFFGNDGDSSQ